MPEVAALFVEADGIYSRIPGVDVWDISRDARLYPGPFPVVAHPPYQRWGRYWSGGPMLARTPMAKLLGDDQGCFAAALAAVRQWGGVLEHPEASHAWRHFGLIGPPRFGGWVTAGDFVGWTCCVEQGHYGHASRKATWLYCVNAQALPLFTWSNSGKAHRLARMDDGFHSAEERRRAVKRGTPSRLSKLQRIATPPDFADALVALARQCERKVDARIRPAQQIGR